MTDPEPPGWATPDPSSPPPPPGAPAGGPPPPPPAGAAPYGPAPYGPAPFPAAAYGGSPPEGTNGLAIASLVLGILWLCGLGSLLAVIFALVALSQISRSGAKGRGLAIGGLVLGIFGLLMVALATVLIVRSADELVTTRSDEADDVEITRCAAGDGGRVTVELAVTNDSSRRSNYLLTILVRERGATSPRESLGTTVDEVDPDATATRVLRTDGGFTNPRCELQFVQRYATP